MTINTTLEESRQVIRMCLEELLVDGGRAAVACDGPQAVGQYLLARWGQVVPLASGQRQAYHTSVDLRGIRR